MSAVAAEQISKQFETAAGPISILRNLNLQLNPGDAISITGPSGSGKSTLLYILGTLEQPSSGRLEMLGQQPFALQPKALAEFRNRSIGFVFQSHHLLPQCTVLENVLLPILASRGVTAADEQRARELLQRVGLSQRLEHRPAQLSGGECQRVAICRALIQQPTIVLADEPTGNLDPESARAVGSLLLDLCRDLQTILVIVTHSMELAERCPQRLELRDGQLVPFSAARTSTV